MTSSPLLPRAYKPPYTPATSLGSELGILMGGIGSMILGSILFWLWWHEVAMKREARDENLRIERLQNEGSVDALNEKIQGAHAKVQMSGMASWRVARERELSKGRARGGSLGAMDML